MSTHRNDDALLKIETFYRDSCYVRFGRHNYWGCNDNHTCEHKGWYWQECFPGCLPDSEPHGPFDSEAEAVADAQSKVQS